VGSWSSLRRLKEKRKNKGVALLPLNDVSRFFSEIRTTFEFFENNKKEPA
jgi:hypothetical protein